MILQYTCLVPRSPSRKDWNETGNQDYNPTAYNAFSPTFDAVDSINEAVRTDTKSYSIYAEGTWNFTEARSATLGGRWMRDEKKFRENCDITVGPSFGFPSCYSSPNFINEKWTSVLDETCDEITPSQTEYRSTPKPYFCQGVAGTVLMPG